MSGLGGANERLRRGWLPVGILMLPIKAGIVGEERGVRRTRRQIRSPAVLGIGQRDYGAVLRPFLRIISAEPVAQVECRDANLSRLVRQVIWEEGGGNRGFLDRKSTRPNSSHAHIS